MKNMLLIIMSLISSLLLGGCGEISQSAKGTASVPEIAFICVNQRSSDAENMAGSTLVTFLSKDGSYYSSDHDPFSELTFDKMIKSFASGEGYVAKLPQTCPKEQIAEQCVKLAGLNSEMDYPDAAPAVESNTAAWYGLYYDENGALCSVKLHEYKRMTDIYSKDSIANEIYEWYRQAIKPDKEQNT